MRYKHFFFKIKVQPFMHTESSHSAEYLTRVPAGCWWFEGYKCLRPANCNSYFIMQLDVKTILKSLCLSH